MTEKEGPVAAFLKGILTTVLATPCTGPFLASASAWAVKQPTWVTFSVFGMLGLGMASPYLLIGAFPNLVRFLPKPGMWIGNLQEDHGPGAAGHCGLAANVPAPSDGRADCRAAGGAGRHLLDHLISPHESQLPGQNTGWLVATVWTLFAIFISFTWLHRGVMLPRFERNWTVAKSVDGPWQPFTLAGLGEKTLVEGRTVLVDFTADWCATCKTFEMAVLETEEVHSAIESANIVTMRADYTNRPPEIGQTIKALNGNGVPIIAIFPADDPYRPIVFLNGYTKNGLIQAIADAQEAEILEHSAAAACRSADRGRSVMVLELIEHRKV